MEQKRKNPLKRLTKWFKRQTLALKIMLSVGILIFCSNMLMLILVSKASTNSLRQKTSEQLQGQLSIALSTVSNAIDDMIDLSVSLSATTAFVTYTQGENDLQTVNKVNESMRVLKQSNKMVDYVALLRTDKSSFLYVGADIPNISIYNILLNHFHLSTTIPNRSGVRGDILDYCYDEPMLNLYCPIYPRRIAKYNRPTGVLVIGLNTEKLLQYVAGSDNKLNLRILSWKGHVIISEQSHEIDQRAEYFNRYTDSQGELRIDDNLIAYQKSANGIWIADSSVSQKVLFAGLRRAQLWLVGIILGITTLAIFISALFTKRFYTPMTEILNHMDAVSRGDLDSKMKPYEDKDFSLISSSFNDMIVAVRGLIASIQRREQENTEIRLNALQSQIKPHFLYNTLECVHWQALIEGAPEASKIVMALSKYYRLCLSKGADIVPISQEVEHTQSYITIQNMRFDDILTVDWDIPEELMALYIPKITLQPLVENAIYHGIKPLEDRKGHVSIRAIRQSEDVAITVSDNGIGMTEEEIQTLNRNIGVFINDGSYGVKNVHQRLEIRYGKGYGLYYQKNQTGGITATIRIPLDSANVTKLTQKFNTF